MRQTAIRGSPLHWTRTKHESWSRASSAYDTVSDVVESRVPWRSEVVLRVKKGVINLFLCISMAYYVNSLKIADVIWASDPQNHCFLGSQNCDLLNFLKGMTYIRWYHVKEHVQSFQNMYGKGG